MYKNQKHTSKNDNLDLNIDTEETTWLQIRKSANHISVLFFLPFSLLVQNFDAVFDCDVMSLLCFSVSDIPFPFDTTSSAGLCCTCLYIR